MAAPPAAALVILLGPGGTGKTALALQLAGKGWWPETDPTIEDIYRIPVTSSIGLPTFVDVFDTGNREVFRLEHYGTALADTLTASLVLCADLCNRLDFRKLPGYEKIPVVFVGNKADLNAKREVVFSEAEPAVKQAGVQAVLECSCKTAEGIDKVQLSLLSILALPSQAPLSPRSPRSPRGSSADGDSGCELM